MNDKEFILRPSNIGCDQCIYLTYRQKTNGCYIIGSYYCQYFKKEVCGRKRLNACKELLNGKEEVYNASKKG